MSFKEKISKGREIKYSSGKVPKREDIKCIAHAHVVRQQKKMFALTREMNKQRFPSKNKNFNFVLESY